RRHTRSKRDWSSDVCSSDLFQAFGLGFTSTSEFQWFREFQKMSQPQVHTLRTSQLPKVVRDAERQNLHRESPPAVRIQEMLFERSEERRVGKECRFRWAKYR